MVQDAADADLVTLERMRRGLNDLLDAVSRKVVEVGARAAEAEAALAEQRREGERLQIEVEQRRVELEGEWLCLKAERESLEDERSSMGMPGARPSDIVTLNVGGERLVQRRRSTLCAVEGSFLAARFSGRWENEVDRDDAGRHFLNYPPDLVMPVLDYLSMRETEGPGRFVPLPTGPPGGRPQFEAMLRFFGLSLAGELDARSIPFESVPWSSCGLVFEVRALSRPVSLLAIETSAGSGGCMAEVFTSGGALEQRRLTNAIAWAEVGRGPLAAKRGSRVELESPMLVMAGKALCIYIATDHINGVASATAESGGVSAENSDVQILAGWASGSTTPFSDFFPQAWRRFNGRLEYSVVA